MRVKFTELSLSLSEKELDEAVQNASLFLGAYEVLREQSKTPLSALLETADDLTEWDHVPPKDAYDPVSRSQYFYHCHSKDECLDGEHGHLHFFVGSDITSEIKSKIKASSDHTQITGKNLTHIGGIAINEASVPVALFTTNFWVCGDSWHSSNITAELSKNFRIDLDSPSREVNNWVTGLVRFSLPYFAELLKLRDQVIKEAQITPEDFSVYSNKEIEVPSAYKFDFAKELANLSS